MVPRHKGLAIFIKNEIVESVLRQFIVESKISFLF